MKFKTTQEQSPDLSFLGVYSDTPDKDGNFIDRELRGDRLRGQFRYFNIGCGDPAYLEADYKRMEAYNSGMWWMLYCWAEAEIEIDGVNQTITSGGVGGVQYDGDHEDREYLKEVAQEELDQLQDQLLALGLKEKKVKQAIARCQDF